MAEWTDPIVIVGIAQIFMALVLALFTAFLWKSTDKYAKLTGKDLEMKERIRRIERCHKELDTSIGPLYSKLGYDPKLPNKNYFNKNKVWGAKPFVTSVRARAGYIESEFWSEIKKNLYLTTNETRKGIKAYLAIKVGTKTWLAETDDGYKRNLKDITDAVENRYKKLTDELAELEKYAEEIKKKGGGWWIFRW